MTAIPTDQKKAAVTWNDPIGNPSEMTVHAEQTMTPGLVITPEVYPSGNFSGYFTITHGPSGRLIPVANLNGVDVDTARRVAHALGTASIDWTAGLDTLTQRFKDPGVLAEIIAAINQGLYPPRDTSTAPAGPADWPTKEEHVTARQLAGHFTSEALARYAWNWLLIGYDRLNAAAKRVYIENVNLLVAQYAVAHLLRAFEATNQAAADEAALNLWGAVEEGDSLGEFLAEWVRQYGIPTPTDVTEVPGVELPPVMSYERVLATPLPNTDYSTIGSARRAIATTAARGEIKFNTMSEEMAGDEHDVPWTDDKRNDHMIAHGCAFHGWALAALLGWLAREYPSLAGHAANIIDDVATNGAGKYCEDLTSSDQDTTP